MSNNSTKNVLDLMRVHYTALRSLAEQLWGDEKDIPITISEWYILSSIQDGNDTITKICSKYDMSRQAAHKFIKGLEGKGIVSSTLSTERKGKKVISLTELGIDCYTETVVLKNKIDLQISERLGKDNFQRLIDLLDREWI
ncbi:MarR family winged helix-turn-helix transcriptional regulator [Sporosarcina thermotolerans]|uniref:MarR family winged helix-turn-helix transcriptional regulator n=1 Tax=Sporosarcina thermotolerans TaxID=633404 RepID=A0AAW9A6E6_9BACL|nr:MarR family winged helix-turn-helix transcriptional regulator [Sporosarcina thermotolerans]MDW0116534.1 MarR family winged helix-turn-helix transcriptional regulator [Sporosarcina thermotolerans]WHT48756.1 MarR family winged helix-turn-helix transcriptional regulator [Sporosarcina thermotolerans]